MPEIAPVTTNGRPTAAATRRAGVAGVGRALPETVVGNEPIAERLGIDGHWIERRTGIRERRHVRDERVSDLAAAAGAAALADAGLAASELDLVLVATMSSDELTPNTAPLVAHALGTNAAAADVGAACTGFLSALSLAGAQIESGRATHALVIGAEAMSRFVDFDDRRTAGLFGDGAGAVVLSAGRGALGPVVLRSAGEHASFIVAPRDTGVIRMEGHETFLVAVSSLSEATLDVCREAEVDPADVDLFIYHQANGRILTAVAERLGLDAGRVVDAIGELGNTSAASIPLALSLAADAGRLSPGDRVLVAAVGAGFTYGAALLDWEGS
ncbi:MAG TPA: beta-ketoacyl-ACP synthase 3 [Solirubrobacteraceae bacterium]